MEKHSKVDFELFKLANWSQQERDELKMRLVSEDLDKYAEAEATVEWEPIDNYWSKVEEARKNWGQVIGLHSGYWEIDKMIGGFAPGEMTIIGAATGVGKSRLTANMAMQQAARGHKVAYASLENDKTQDGLRFENIIGKENIEWIRKHDTLRTIKNQRIEPECLRYLVKKAKNWGAEIIYIDHLHFFGRDMKDQASGIGIITQELHYLAEEFEVPLVVVSHLRKMELGQSEPTTDDLRGSSYIGQDADNILLLWKGNERGHVFVKVAKHRNRALWEEGATVEFQHTGLTMLKNPYEEAIDRAYSVIG